jgi:hypothetical protein
VWCNEFRSLGLESYDIAIKTLQPVARVAPVKDKGIISQLPQPSTVLRAGDLQAALDAFATREMMDYASHGRCHSDIWICGFGVVLWLMGDTEAAGKVWSRACDEALRGKFKYSSTGTFQSGLLLWFASVWLKNEDWHDEAAALFDKLLRKKWLMGGRFSILLAKFLRREIDLPEVRAGCTKRPAEVQDPDEWKVLFYAGVRAYEDGNPAETRQLWAQAKEPTDTTGSLEYYLLAHERKKLG